MMTLRYCKSEKKRLTYLYMDPDLMKLTLPNHWH